METFTLPDGRTMRVHERGDCAGRACTIHNPTDHHMREWVLQWRTLRGIFERTCEHGVGHPDPDQMPYWQETDQEWQAIHGCCGCCAPRRTEGNTDD